MRVNSYGNVVRRAVVVSAFIFLLAPSTSVMAQAATDVKCSGCVNGSDIAQAAVSTDKLRREAVTGSKIARFAVSTDKLRKGAVIGDKLAPLAVSTDKIRDGSVTGVKIAAGAVGVTQIDPGQVQMRVGGSCVPGSFIAAIAEDGAVTCEEAGPLEIFSVSGIDVTPDVPVVDSELFWLPDCLTPPYTAGIRETAIVTASIGYGLNLQSQGSVVTASFVGGVPTGHGQGYLWFDTAAVNATVMHHIYLIPGVEYQFGAITYVQGGGVTRHNLSCQTMVQIVRTPDPGVN